MKRERRKYTDEFKQQMVKLVLNGRTHTDVVREYDLTPSSLTKWIRQSQNSGSFREQDNRTTEEKELMKLRKENKCLLMQVDILKQAALIMGQK